MKNKNYLIVIVIGVLVTLVLLIGAYKNGFSKGALGWIEKGSSQMSNYSSISDLQKSVSFDFKVPNIIASKESELVLINYMGTMVEIKSADMVFKAAKFISNKADVSGDYTDFNIDRYFIDTSGIVYVRYRASDNKTIVNLSDSNIAYSIEFSNRLDLETALNKLDIQSEMLNEISDTEYFQDNKGAEISTNASESGTDIDKDVRYEYIEDSKSNIKFMVPVIESKLDLIEDSSLLYSKAPVVMDNSRFVLLLNGKLVFIIDKSNEQVNEGYTVNELDGGYILRYIVNNPFDKADQAYLDYHTIIENIDIVINTFKVNG